MIFIPFFPCFVSEHFFWLNTSLFSHHLKQVLEVVVVVLQYVVNQLLAWEVNVVQKVAVDINHVVVSIVKVDYFKVVFIEFSDVEVSENLQVVP